MASREGTFVTLCLFLALISQANAFQIYWKSNDSNVYVIDGAFDISKKVLGRAVKVLKSQVWKFTVDEVFGTGEAQPLRLGFSTKANEQLKELKAPNIIQKLISKTFGCSTVFVTDVQGRIIERGDFSPVVTQCSGNSSRLVAILTLSRKWKKNDYGEITVYDKHGDILRSIHPKFGRVVLIKCGNHFKISPPSVNMERRHYFLVTEFGHEPNKDKDQMTEEVVSLSEFFNERSKADDDENTSNVIDPENVLTKKFLTSEGKKIFVYDNAIPLKYVDILHDYVHSHADYFESPVTDRGSDNVKWIISLDDPGFVDGPIWNIIKQLLVHVAGKEFFPYDLACNHVRRTDNTYTHKDNYDDADEYTVLIYLNKNWKEDDYGETTYLEGNEIIAALRPRYGRVVIFHGTIDHSAHPASPSLQGARYTFAIKTAASKESALVRIFQNEGDTSYSEVMQRLNQYEENGSPKQKDFAKKAISKLKTGRLPGEEFIQKVLSFVGMSK